MNRALDEKPRSRRADFALVGKGREERAVDGGFEIGVGENDIGFLPPSSRVTFFRLPVAAVRICGRSRFRR